jgi:hypothetical protein
VVLDEIDADNLWSISDGAREALEAAANRAL